VHPLFARPSRLLLYLAVWLVDGVLLAAAFAALTSRPFAQALAFMTPLALLYGLICLSAWWVCRSRPIEVDPVGALMAHSLAAIQSSVAWVIVATAWGVLLARMFGVAFDQSAMLRDAIVLFVIGVPLYLLSAVVHYLLLALEASHEATERALASQVSAREAELRALRAQLNPHFLFNSLNSINALIGGDPETARRMCEGLGDFLRKTLQLGAREAVTLGEELALVDRYLTIEQVRFGDRLKLERAIDPATLDCLLPPLLLQPLVENAIKHGVADRLDGGTVRLATERHQGQLIVTLENPVDVDAPARPGEGLGLENVRRRLAVLGPREGSLVVAREPDHFRVTLSLAARAAERPAEARHA
jgi:sensor histidine kinase YesM